MIPIGRKRMENAVANKLGLAFDLQAGKYVNFEIIHAFSLEVRDRYIQGHTSARLHWCKGTNEIGTTTKEQEHTMLWLVANMPRVLQYWGLADNDFSITRYTDEFIIGFHEVKIPTCTSGRISV